ncbi:MAG: hypothetical protein ACTSPC_13200 [Candidatus Heimdallarchaeota archaeon]
MPLESPEEKKNAIKWIWKILSTYGLTVILGLGTVWGYLKVNLEDQIKKITIDVLEEVNDKESFRDILGDQLEIPSDVVPYYLTGKIIEIDSIESQIRTFEENYIPFLETQMKITVIYRFLDEVGDEWWHGFDGRNYRVNYDNGQPWVVYHGHRKDL